MSDDRTVLPLAPLPPLDDELVERILESEESHTFETKRLGKNIASSLETIDAFANADGRYRRYRRPWILPEQKLFSEAVRKQPSNM